jgi:hypothetical protein
MFFFANLLCYVWFFPFLIYKCSCKIIKCFLS